MGNRNITLYRKGENGDAGANFDQYKDGTWTCTHGGWTGQLNEETLEMFHPNSDILIVKYDRLVENG